MYPDPLFTIGNVSVYAYGLCMAVGIILCFVFLLWTFSYKNFNEECTDKMLLLGVVATGIGILFAMLFQSLYNYIDTGKFTVHFRKYDLHRRPHRRCGQLPRVL